MEINKPKKFQLVKPDWKFRFTDIAKGLFEITHKTGHLYTIKILSKPTKGCLSVSNYNMYLSENEFVMSGKLIKRYLILGIIKKTK